MIRISVVAIDSAQYKITMGSYSTWLRGLPPPRIGVCLLCLAL